MKKIIALLLVLAMALGLAACSGNPYEEYEYINEMLAEGDYEGAMLAVQELYYLAHAEEDDVPPLGEPTQEESDMIWAYIDIVRNLEYYEENGYFSFYDQEEETSYSGNLGFAIAYETLQEMEAIDNWLNEDWLAAYWGVDDVNCDRQGILDRFVVIPDVALSQTNITSDNMGNTDERFEERMWHYDTSGSLVWDYTSWDSTDIFNYTNLNGNCYYIYDETGKVVQKRYGYEDTTDALITYTFDESGKIINENVKRNNGERDYLYAYDDAGRLSSISWDEGYDHYRYDIVYTYDGSGRLASQVYTTYYLHEETFHPENVHTMTYHYDGSGNLASADYNYSYYWLVWNQETRDYDWPKQREQTAQYTYTCDSAGRLINTTIIPTDTYYCYGDDAGKVYSIRTYVQKMQEIVYGDYYLYTPMG